MDIISYTGFKKIAHSIIFQPQTVPKSRALIESDHLGEVKETRF